MSLQPCPFCGAKEDIPFDECGIEDQKNLIEYSGYSALGSYQAIWCTQCGTQGPGDPYHVGARHKWNTRRLKVKKIAHIHKGIDLIAKGLEDTIKHLKEKKCTVKN